MQSRERKVCARVRSINGASGTGNLDPEAYLSDVLARICGSSRDRVAELLPWNLELVDGTRQMYIGFRPAV